ncbi:hypothetical protein BDW02DRAFT_600524 [Decorospora gaudefroyi]|uniref:Uncharacterized protein n=1 Tax=Decorospora gaudefroyi TaxID=184978 RepID=A0A6A5K3U5_9PLEO|nr:hypothetical protein BDW02DRAFT_600524 [Decorospora gaudefroyi]
MATNTSNRSYTGTVITTLQSLLGPKAFSQYAHIITRVYNGQISAAAALPALGFLLKGIPKGTMLHNEITDMTQDLMLIHNLPELHKQGSDLEDVDMSGDLQRNLDDELQEMVQRFDGTAGSRPADAWIARGQVAYFLQEVLRKQNDGLEIDELSAEMAALGL